MTTAEASFDLKLGKLGAGLMQWGTTDIDNKIVNPKGNLAEDDVRAIWKTCRDHNIVFFDTAEGYGGGTSEMRVRSVKKWYEDNLNGKPEGNVVIATKFLPTLWRWTKSSFYKSLRGSLDRLGVNCIDLYFIHTPIHPLPLQYFIQWACDAVDDGLIKHIGISNCDADLTLRAAAVAKKNGKRIACNQIMLNLLVWKSVKHQETVRTCHELGIQIVAYSPIGQGLLTDSLTEDKFAGIRAVKMTGVKLHEIHPLRAKIQAISDTRDCTMAQVAINWVRGHGAVPLVGCRSVKQVEDAAQSVSWDLSKEEVEELDNLSLGLSLFERPLYRRGLFVVFISLLQLAYYTEQKYKQIKKILFPPKSGNHYE
jgi:aryl-alcohol dehydrogenase-like predicted oxidoreductase